MLRSFDPFKIQCGTHQNYGDDKCDPLLRELPADTMPKVTFGPVGQPGVDYGLPFYWNLAREQPFTACWQELSCQAL